MRKGIVIDRRQGLSPYYDLSFEIRPLGIVSGWSNIIHATIGNNIGKYGDRTPAVFFLSRTTRLHICSAVNGNVNYCWNSSPLPLLRYSRIRITQQEKGNKLYYMIFINKRRMLRIENKRPEFFQNVQVYSADKWYSPSKATIRRYKLVDRPNGKIFVYCHRRIQSLPKKLCGVGQKIFIPQISLWL